jgi:hypothetical protein
MPITMSPQVLTASTDAYITQGVTARLQTFTGAAANGAITVSVIDFPVTVLRNQTATSTITFSNVPDNYANTWWVEVANRGSNTVNFANVSWDGGGSPTLATTGKSVLEFYSRDGGTSIYGRVRFTNVA